MIKKICLVLFGCTIALFLSSCSDNGLVIENFIEPKIPNKIITISYLCPDLDQQQIYVSLASKIGDSVKIGNIANGAKVYIRDLSKPDSFLVNRQTNPCVFVFSQNEFPLKLGATYRITIKYNQDVIYGETTIPSKRANFNEVSLTNYGKIKYFNLNSVYEAHLFLSWNNIDSTNKFTYLYSYLYSGGVRNDVIPFYSDSYTENNFKCFTDEIIPIFNPGPITINLTLLTCDHNIKKFNVAIDNYKYSSSGFSLLDQFTGVYPEYSNVKNGAGVITSYLIHKETYTTNVKL